MLKIYKYKKGYYVKGDDIYIINYLLNYKIKNNKIYFNRVSKVKKVLDKNNVNYIYNNKVNIYYNNNYYIIIKKYKLIKEINDKLNNMIEKRDFNKIYRCIINE